MPSFHKPGKVQVAPGLRAGRGLKHLGAYKLLSEVQVAPGLRAGRGLKQSCFDGKVRRFKGSSRPSGWERIETSPPPIAYICLPVAPGLRAGRGLKREQEVFNVSNRA